MEGDSREGRADPGSPAGYETRVVSGAERSSSFDTRLIGAAAERTQEAIAAPDPPPPTWEGPVFFHYTRPDYAAAIFDERTYRVSSRADPEYGTGLWVTDIAPETMSGEELHATLLPHQPIEYTHGVVVLVRHPDFRQVREHEFFLERHPNSDVDLREIAVAVGRKTDDGWDFRREPPT